MFIRRCPSYFGTFLIIFEAPKCPECVDEYDDIKLDVLFHWVQPVFPGLDENCDGALVLCVGSIYDGGSKLVRFNSSAHTRVDDCLFVCWSLHPFAFAALFFLLHIKY